MPIEKGRHLGIERNKRLCTLCNKNVIDDECHFYLSVTIYFKKGRHLLNILLYKILLQPS